MTQGIEVTYAPSYYLSLARLGVLAEVIQENGMLVQYRGLNGPEKMGIIESIKGGKAVSPYITQEELDIRVQAKFMEITPQADLERFVKEAGLNYTPPKKPIAEERLREQIIGAYTKRTQYHRDLEELMPADKWHGESSLEGSAELVDVLLRGYSLVTEMETLLSLYASSFGEVPATTSIAEEYKGFKDQLDQARKTIIGK